MKDAAINWPAWLVASLLAIAFALVQSDSVIVGNEFLPFGNDAFYHARRILDAAFSGDGLYQFDPLMHVSEGSWISWPWGFDYLLAKLLQFMAWVSPATNPMRVLVYAPVLWIPVNVALLLAMTATLGLRPEFRVMVAIGFALMPITQTLHGIGAIDHHFMELTFVLLITWLLLKMLAQDSGRAIAMLCGASLGLAQAFHHGLFVLQLPVLATFFLLWVRNDIPAAADLRALAIALFLSTMLISLPSGPLLDGQFSFSTLSWFHPYVALCSATLLIAISARQFSRRSLLILAAAGILLALPAAGGIYLGAQFLTGDLLALDSINEMVSPLRMITGNWGLTGTVWIYSWLMLLAPVLVAAGIWLIAHSRKPQDVAFAFFSIFGISLLLMQMRLNYFGLAFLLSAPFFYAEKIWPAAGRKRALIALAATVVLAVAFQPPLSGGLFKKYPLAGDHLYHSIRPLLPVLQDECKKQPGVVIANRHFGHPIRFHTSCSVIANNFLLTPQHSHKVMVADYLFTLDPKQVARQAPDARYILAYLNDAYEQRDGLTVLKNLDDVAARNPQLIRTLFFAQQLPANVELLKEIEIESQDGVPIVIAGLYRLVKP